MRVVLKDESYSVMGACFEVCRDKGPGFVEPIYHECLEMGYEYSKVPVVSKPWLEIENKGRKLTHAPAPDFVCFGKLILEIKAVESLCDFHCAQLLNYLKATGYDPGLLVNFCAQGELEWERILRTEDPKKYSESDSPPNLLS